MEVARGTGSAVYLLVFYGVFCMVPSKTLVFLLLLALEGSKCSHVIVFSARFGYFEALSPLGHHMGSSWAPFGARWILLGRFLSYFTVFPAYDPQKYVRFPQYWAILWHIGQY